jgi:uracil-DNA glycosylase family 4
VSVASAPKPGGMACATCPARHGKCLPPEPARTGVARLAVVGDSPGRGDLDNNLIWSAGGGRLLMRGLATVGLRRGDVHWTNAVLCECKDDELPAARKACAPRLRTELAGSGASVIMPTGSHALHSAMALPKRPAILKWRGSVSEVALEGPARPPQTIVAPTIHPSWLRGTPKWAPILEIDIARVGRLLALHAQGRQWVPPEAEPGRRTVVARTEETLVAELAGLGKAVGNDVETVGLGPTETLLVCLALSDGTTTLVIPWSRGRDGREAWWIAPDRIAAHITRALATRVSVTHNGPSFDHIVEERYGIRHTAWEDTLLAAHTMTSHLPKNLAQVVTTYLDVPPWKLLEDRTADLERLWMYNGRDTLYTILAWQRLHAELREAA